MKRVRLSTLMLLVVIAALSLALVVQHRRLSGQLAERDGLITRLRHRERI